MRYVLSRSIELGTSCTVPGLGLPWPSLPHRVLVQFTPMVLSLKKNHFVLAVLFAADVYPIFSILAAQVWQSILFIHIFIYVQCTRHFGFISTD